MVTRDEYLPSGTVLFPAYRLLPEHTRYVTVRFQNPSDVDGPLAWFWISTPLHSSFAAEWPISVDVPLALRGFRCALGLSQVKFADAVGLGRLNVERWETGKSRPFRGHTLSLLDILRHLVDGPLSAGQLLNLAAAVVCPCLTRPTAIYSAREIAAPLAEKRIDHTDLAPALLEALVSSEVLVPLDPSDDSLDARYIPLVGVSTLNRETEPWESQLHAIAQRLDPKDRSLWLALGERLGRHSESRP